MGLGLACIPCIAVIAEYFKRYYSLAIGIVFSGAGIGGFVFPPVVQYLEVTYGWRGAMLVHAGIILNVMVLGALFRPITLGFDGNGVTQIKDVELDNSAPNPSCSKHIQILTNKILLIVTFQGVIVWFGIVIVYVHLVAFIEYSGFTKNQAVFTMSVLGVTISVGRTIWGLSINIQDSYIL